jgi:catechol 2,3-dioxygenase-like lactoylglutathione lyase family enzyme
MNLSNKPLNLNATDSKSFIGSKDFETSCDFYTAMGWTLNWEQENLAELQLGSSCFYLQRYYQKKWCENAMLHITVEDAQAWYEHATRVLTERKYGAARVRPPKEESYGSLVTYVWDPVGVLLHFAQPIKR